MNNITKFRGNQTERFTTITDGVVPAPETSTGKFLRDDGTWVEISGSTSPTGSSVVWGGISGSLSNQTDLQSALDNKLNKNLPITGSTKVKITYDSNGLITSGSDATTADITEVTDKRYVTDAQIVILENTSGVNSGDETTTSIKSKLNSASLSSDGYLTSGSFSVFNSKQDALGYTPANKAGDTFTGNISASNLSGTNTGDETTATIQSKRPLKTVNSQSLEGSGNVDLTNGFTTITKSADQDMNNTTGDDTELQFAVTSGSVYLIEFVLIMSSNNTTADSRYYFRTTSATLQGAATMTNITSAVGGSTQLVQANSNYSAVVAMGTTTAASLDYPLTAFGSIAFRSSADDTLRVGFGVNTGTSGAITRMWKDSYIKYKKIK